MKYVNSVNGFRKANKETNETLLFGRTGDVLQEGELYKVQHYAKKMKTNNGESYYAMTYQGSLFDPMGPYGRRERALDMTLKRVSKNTFDFYITYLKTNNSIYMTKAQRGLLND